jgi:hypothetical protein
MVLRIISAIFLFTLAAGFATEAPKRIYTTQRLQSAPPTIDGKLDDACWKEGVWFDDFVQFMPQEGAGPSQKTALKILYDSKYLYIAMRGFDTEPEKIDSRAGRRDEQNGDMLGVCFDSYFNHLSGFEFDLNARGTKTDLILMNNMQWDMNWDAVWDGKVAKEDSAWTAEMRVPFSQLRYSDKAEQVWGMHAWRWINRLQEEDQFSLIPRNGPGHLYDMGYLHGLENLPKNRRIEFLPYTVGQFRSVPAVSSDPLNKKHEFNGDAGLDGKIGLSSDFTMDFTINPDFGQVEADPSVLNLSVYEVFYDEKRPFFLEGKNVYDFSLGGDLLFYSRRIGHSPSYYPELGINEYAKIPESTAILGAAKITGRTKDGLSIGIIESVTGQENARIATPHGQYSQAAEPLSNYFIARIKKELNDSNTLVGGILTSAQRRLNQPQLYFLTRNAITGGVDFRQYFDKKKYNLGIKFVGSTVDGEQAALQRLQQSSIRYYQRPDADYLDYDSTATRLSGHGGSLEFNKESYGHWRFNTGLSWKSPGLELNDLGFVTITDEIGASGNVAYVQNDPVGIFREYTISGGMFNTWNFARDFLNNHLSAGAHMSFVNRWQLGLDFIRISETLDTRLLRGGPAIYVKGFTHFSANIGTDFARRLAASMNIHHHIYDDNVSRFLNLSPGVTCKVTDALQISTNVNYSLEKEMLHYVSKVSMQTMQNQDRYILGEMDRKTLGLTMRFDFALTPDLTVQYYGNPYISVGTYTNFRSVRDHSSREYEKAFHLYSGADIKPCSCGQYAVDENGDQKYDFTFYNPDFNFREFRSNLVLRWEFKPGSTFYLVWSHGRSSYEDVTNRSLQENWNTLWNLRAQNIFMAKFSYWFAI